MSKKTLAIAIFVSFFLFPVSKTYAQKVTLSISPPIIEAKMKPSKSILIAYTIQNQADPVILSTKILSFTPSGPDGAITHNKTLQGPVQFNLDNARLKLGDSFFLKSGQSEQILLRITVPESSPEGDYYYTLFISSEASKTKEGVVAPAAAASIGSNILITVTDSGRLENKARISFFNTVGGFIIPFLSKKTAIFESNSQIPLKLIVENSGKNMIRTEGKITMSGFMGAKSEYNLIPQNILAFSQRTLQASPSANTDSKNSSKNKSPIREGFTMLLNEFFIGKYQLNAIVTTAEGTQQLNASTSFFAMPVKLILGLIFAAFVSFVFIRRFMKEKI